MRHLWQSQQKKPENSSNNQRYTFTIFFFTIAFRIFYVTIEYSIESLIILFIVYFSFTTINLK